MDYLDLAKQLQVANKAKKADKASQTVQLPFADVRIKSATETVVNPSVALPAELEEKVDDYAAELRPAPSGIALPAKPDTVPRLPWQLERLLSAASSGVLAADIPGVPDVPRYTLSWGCSYLTGDRTESERRLWQVYRAWQGVN